MSTTSDSSSSDAAVMEAVESNNTTRLGLLLEQRAYLYGEAGHEAARRNHVTALKLLLEHALPVDILDSEGRTPLLVAASSGSYDCVLTLLSYGCNVYFRSVQDDCNALQLLEQVTPSSENEARHKEVVATLAATYSGELEEGMPFVGCNVNDTVTVGWIRLLSVTVTPFTKKEDWMDHWAFLTSRTLEIYEGYSFANEPLAVIPLSSLRSVHALHADIHHLEHCIDVVTATGALTIHMYKEEGSDEDSDVQRWLTALAETISEDLVHMQPPSLEEVDLEGYLTKRGEVRRNWKKRWVVASGPILRYFEDERKKKQKGMLDLRSFVEVIEDGTVGKEHAFTVAVPGRRDYTFVADDSKALSTWMAHCNKWVSSKHQHWDREFVAVQKMSLEATSSLIKAAKRNHVNSARLSQHLSEEELASLRQLGVRDDE